jgi:hypothetical protein
MQLALIRVETGPRWRDIGETVDVPNFRSSGI